MRFLLAMLPLLLAVTLAGCATESEEKAKEPAVKEVILATTTSTYDTGLLDVLVPDFQEKTGYVVKPIAVGTGRALAMGEMGEADVLLVHAPDAERELVEKGAVVDRTLVMHNYFAIVGPPEDAAGVQGGEDAALALKRIAGAQALFVSRGDDSGTHKMERSLWTKAGIEPSGRWYQETGQSMGATLRVASEKGGYTLPDRGTFLALKKTLYMAAMVEGDPLLLNVYSVMLANPERYSRVNANGGRAFAQYLVSAEAQAIIREFGIAEYGEPLFIPDAGKREEDLSR